MHSKPRDESGNDFIVPCAFMAEKLFYARFKRKSDPKSASDTAVIRNVSSQLYSVVMSFWKVWDIEK